jgi:hypothetical protein
METTLTTRVFLLKVALEALLVTTQELLGLMVPLVAAAELALLPHLQAAAPYRVPHWGMRLVVLGVRRYGRLPPPQRQLQRQVFRVGVVAVP